MKKNFAQRRPVEFLLYLILVALLSMAVWIGMARLDEKKTDNPVGETQSVVEPGTTEEIDYLTEQVIDEEEDILQSSDEDNANLADSINSSADDIGGAYDETAF